MGQGYGPCQSHAALSAATKACFGDLCVGVVAVWQECDGLFISIKCHAEDTHRSV